MSYSCVAGRNYKARLDVERFTNGNNRCISLSSSSIDSPAMTDNQQSAILGGILGIAGVLIGFLATTLQIFLTRRARRKGVSRILAYEVGTNVRDLLQGVQGRFIPTEGPNYLWEALRGEAPSLLTSEQVSAIAIFYHTQAQFYKKRGSGEEDVEELIRLGQLALTTLGEPATHL